MRRAIAVIIGGGLVLGASLPMAATSLAAARAPAGRTITYAGYEITVPASWPVYRLDADPGQCVRYDVHAVYLGTPGVNQQCPAGLVGRTETVSILPAAGQPSATLRYTRANGEFPGVRGTVLRDASVHDIQVVPGGSAASTTVTATYGTDQALVGRVLATLRPAPAGAPETPALPGAGPRTGPQAAAPALSRPDAALPPASTVSRAGTGPQAGPVPEAGTAPQEPGTPHAGGPTQTPVVSPSWHGLPTSWPTEITESPPVPVRPRPVASLLGFDTCVVPSLATMKAWRKRYAVVGIYLGGVNAACYGGNLTTDWIQDAAAMGWSMLPAYVGPQAPCYGYGTMIDPRLAVREGTLAAQDAAWDAGRLGLPARSPVYYDMEAYDNEDSACTAAVLSFLGAWTRQLNYLGYVSGVYSSMNSGISDMQAARVGDLWGFTPPQALWYAKWDSQRELHDRALSWPPYDLSKQYRGPHDVTLGGVTMNIDTDLVGGPTAR
jgi:hypothetical protein